MADDYTNNRIDVVQSRLNEISELFARALSSVRQYVEEVDKEGRGRVDGIERDLTVLRSQVKMITEDVDELHATHQPGDQTLDGPKRDSALSLRDYFAGMCLQGWLASFGDATEHPGADPWVSQRVAKMSYKMADAMLDERSDR